MISGHKGRLTFEAFHKWAEKNNALNGFNLTENLELQFYADLDPHKKGYLVLSDWENAFGTLKIAIKQFLGRIKWSDQLLTEFQDVIYSNFNDIESAFLYFVKNVATNGKVAKPLEVSLDFKDFSKSVGLLLPKRFSQPDLEALWEQIIQNNSNLNYNLFSAFLNANKFQKPEKSTK